MTTLGEFLAAIALMIVLALGGRYAWMGQNGANFNPDVHLDSSQVIDGGSHGLLTV